MVPSCSSSGCVSVDIILTSRPLRYFIRAIGSPDSVASSSSVGFLWCSVAKVASVDELNIALQKIANPQISEDEQIDLGRVLFRKGDKVMQVSNNYDKGVYNGDVGIITEVSIAKKKLRVDFQGLIVDYYDNEFDQLKHAFATTVHKVQGSQYPVVIMVVTNYHSMMLLRNLLYTGVTRAQQRLIIVGDEDAVKFAIRNVKNNTRLSALAEKLTNTA